MPEKVHKFEVMVRLIFPSQSNLGNRSRSVFRTKVQVPVSGLRFESFPEFEPVWANRHFYAFSMNECMYAFLCVFQTKVARSVEVEVSLPRQWDDRSPEIRSAAVSNWWKALLRSKWSERRVSRKARSHHSTGVSVVVFLASDVQTVQWKETRVILSEAVTRKRESKNVKDARVGFL